MDSVKSIFEYQRRADQDYYSILGCAQSSTIEQIQTEYKHRALQLHPDKNLDKPECLEQFRQLQRAKDVLSDRDKRKSYDQWLNSGVAVDFERWLARNMNHSMHWAPRNSGRQTIEQANRATVDTNEHLGQFYDDQLLRNRHVNGRYRRGHGNDLLSKFRNYEI